MSLEHQRAESDRWLRQAADDLSAASVLEEHGKYAQACFMCQQSGEKSVKAVWLCLGLEPWGHSILRLIDELNDEKARPRLASLVGQARTLDRLYIPTRYPNGLPEITPQEAYDSRDASEALAAARAFLDGAKEIVAA